MILSYALIAFTCINLVHTLLNLYVMWLFKRKESFAVITKKDGGEKVVKINLHRDHFIVKDVAYIVPKDSHLYTLKIGNKKYVRYVENTPEPFKWWTDDKPEIPGDVFHSIIESKSLKLLNTPPLGTDLLKILLIVGAAVVVVIIVMNSMNGG